MRVLVVFLFLAGGFVTATSQSSAQDIVPMPARTVADGSFGMGPLGHRGGGTFQYGDVSSESAACGCCEDGNCACHGSYKYPVPSQYTYFWPGIYSQQRMTQYVSPWRCPCLNPIPEHWKVDPTEDTSPYSGYRY